MKKILNVLRPASMMVPIGTAPLHGIASLLDKGHETEVEELWSELEQGFGLRGVFATRFPHFSYEVAQEYDLEQLGPILENLAATQPPFRVRTTGLGVFTGARVSLFVPVVRSPILSQFHERIWQETAHIAKGLLDYYRPENWLPHITLAHGDMDHEHLPGILDALSEREFYWEIPVTNISLLHNLGTKQEVKFSFALTG